ncbi:MAG: tagaturonate epimerase family protein [Trueperaceae bacterium]
MSTNEEPSATGFTRASGRFDDSSSPLPDTAYPNSFVRHGAGSYWLERVAGHKHLVVSSSDEHVLDDFDGQTAETPSGTPRKSCPTNSGNAAALRRALPWLTPRPLGLATSAGMGDRLGIATPGHVLALARVGAGISPIFAQQSIREMTRTHRSPEQVMTDATWGAFEAGWRAAVGADADHLKTFEDIDRCVAAGFTFFTIDPGEHVDDGAHDLNETALRENVGALPWDDLDTSLADLETRFRGRVLDLDGGRITFDTEAVLRAASKYGRAVAHVHRMYRHLEAKGVPSELEISVDETAYPTSHLEHAYVALELLRLGVRWVSLAPRFVGGFEKGIDYLGDSRTLRADLVGHAAVARALGPYKLSLHSGSDKFSVYAPIMAATRGLVHLKTAGTSYLEALRVVASVQPDLFREVAALATERFETDRATYHISSSLHDVPAIDTLSDQQLPQLLDADPSRQVLHVTFGSALDAFRGELMAVLREHEERHYQGLAAHFERHLRPFATGNAQGTLV